MKKLLSIILSSVLSVCSVTAFSADTIRIVLNGTDLNMSVPSQIIDGRTMVPLRGIFQHLGATVEWNQETRTITSQKDGTEVIMQVDNPVMTVNGETIVLDVAPVIVNDNTLVPVRAIAESYNMRVNWYDEDKVVAISDITPLIPGDYVFDYESYEIMDHNNAYVTIGKTKYYAAIPEELNIVRERCYANHEIFCDDIWYRSSETTMRFNTGSYSGEGIFVSFDDFLTDYKERWPSSTDTYESIYFEPVRIGKHLGCIYINKHIQPFIEATDPEIKELQDLTESMGLLDKSDKITYEGVAYIINPDDYSDVCHLEIYTTDETKVDMIKSIITSLRTE